VIKTTPILTLKFGNLCKFLLTLYFGQVSVVKKYAKTLFIDFSWTLDMANTHAPYHVT